MIRISLGEYTLTVSNDYPSLYKEYHKRANLVNVFEDKHDEGTLFFVSVAKGADWPFLMVMQRYTPGSSSGFYPGVLLLPETHLLFIGAGERLLAYALDSPGKLWEERTWPGFLGWERYRQFVIMSGEIELATWDIHGKKLWDYFVEPPWSYVLEDNTIHVDVMGKMTSFSLQHGPGK